MRDEPAGNCRHALRELLSGRANCNSSLYPAIAQIGPALQQFLVPAVAFVETAFRPVCKLHEAVQSRSSQSPSRASFQEHFQISIPLSASVRILLLGSAEEFGKATFLTSFLTTLSSATKNLVAT